MEQAEKASKEVNLPLLLVKICSFSVKGFILESKTKNQQMQKNTFLIAEVLFFIKQNKLIYFSTK